MKNFSRLIFMVFLFLSSTAGAEEPPEAASIPDFRNGDTWELSIKFPVDCQRWEGHGEVDGYLVGQCKNYLMYATVDNANWVKFADTDGNLIAEYKPFLPFYNFPLKMGKQWEGKYSGFIKGDPNPRWKSTFKARVVAYEEVSVPYGAYMAYKVEYEDHWDVNGFKGVAKGTYWMSPELKFVLKNENKGDPRYSYELLNVQTQ